MTEINFMKKIFLIIAVFTTGLITAQTAGIPVTGVTPIQRLPSENPTIKTDVLPASNKLAITTAPTGNSTEVGITEGALSVSLSGAATYNIPIAVPPGINGVVPQVSLNYNSQSGNGMAGYGWNIAGVSMISRIPRTMFHDGIVGGVNVDMNDRFALDGQRLIAKNGGIYGADGTQYETENFSNLKITSIGSVPFGAAQKLGPAYFKVEYPDGSVAQYGVANVSCSISSWYIDFWKNPQGVIIKYDYYHENNFITLKNIKYGALENGQQLNEIQFIYDTRSRPEQSYLAGDGIINNTILKEIKVTVNGGGFRSYKLAYDPTLIDYQRLKSITESSSDGTKSYNPTVFNYGSTASLFKVQEATTLSISGANATNGVSVTGDFDGDGKNDFIIYPKTGPDAYKKYWLYNDIYSGRYNLGLERNEVGFKDIFTTSYLTGNITNGFKIDSKQGFTIVKKNGETSYNFSVYSTQLFYGAHLPVLEYEKTVPFPTVSIQDGCAPALLTCNKKVAENRLFPKKILSGDFNGDGLTDVITIDLRLIYKDCKKNFGSCTTPDLFVDSQKVYFIDLKKDVTANFYKLAGNINEIATESTNIQVVDFNSDGKSDFIVFTAGKVTVYTLDINNNLSVLATLSDAGIQGDKPQFLGDFNGDGKTDFMIPQVISEDKWNFYLSNGNTFKIKTAAIGLTYPSANTSSLEISFFTSDFNGDGKTDILRQYNKVGEFVSLILLENKSFSDSKIDFYRDGSVTNLTVNTSYPIPLFTNHTQSNRNLQYSILTDNNIYTFTSNRDNRIDTCLKSLTTGNGVTESITYKPLIDDGCIDGCYSPYTATLNKSYYPYADIAVAPGLQVVTMVEKQSKSVYKKQLFAYAGATSNMQGLGRLGFRASMRTNWFEYNSQIISTISKFDPLLRGANTESYTYLGFRLPDIIATQAPAPSTGLVNNIIKKDYTVTGTETLMATGKILLQPGISGTIIKSGSTFVGKILPNYDSTGFTETNTTPDTNLITKSLNKYETTLSPTKVYKLQNVQAKNYNILDNTSGETNTSYDSYNNPLEISTKLKNGGIDEQTTVTTLTYDNQPTGTSYYIGRPLSKNTAVSAYSDSMNSKEIYGYGTGLKSNLLTQIQKSGNNTNPVIEDNEYDNFGNITKKTISATGISPRVTSYKYDTTGRFLIESTDLEGFKTIFDYYPNSTLKYENKQTELGSTNNTLTTTYEYDSWFKKIKTTDYLGKTNNYAYTRNSEKTIITTTGDDGSYSQEIFDDMGRKITVGVKDVQGNMSYKDYQYDIYDRNFNTSEPYSSSATQWNTNEYDVYGRTIKVTSFTGKIAAINYNKLTNTVTDSSTGQTKAGTKNAMGKVVKMVETPIGGTINYSYFANGNVKETSYDGTSIKITQDGWGRKTSLSDPSAGVYTYAYNDLGEMLEETTPNGKTTYTLDPATGKLNSKTIVGTNTNSATVYNYDPVNKLLTSSVFTDNNEAKSTTNLIAYDAYKRVSKTTETTPYAKFEKTVGYDSFGRVKTETKTATLGTKSSTTSTVNNYQYGYAYQITENNPSAKVLWQTNTVNARGQLTEGILGNGISIKNTYDTYNFPAQSKHFIAGTSPVDVMVLNTSFDAQRGNLMSRTNSLFATNEAFTYDTQDRLLTYPNGLGVTQTQNYEDSGRIKDNTSLGTYNYTESSKYRNTSVTLAPAALPDYQAKPLQNITYNTFKSPVEISESGVDKISFVYNDGNSRSTMFYSGVQSDKLLRTFRKHYSADGSMEIKENRTTGAIEFVTYIGGDAYSSNIVVKSDGTTQNYLYLHRDYQGSILAITNALAQVVEKRLFDAWGAIAKVQDGAGNTLTVLTILDRGYTGHEHLQTVGLIHMNGRLYDPKLHRFLQPDNYVQDPSNTQNFNRYGYVMNNPLKYSDPTGEFTFSDLIAAAAIVVGVVLTIVTVGTGAVIGAGLIGAGLAHFGATYAEYSNTGDWNTASNNAGFSFSTKVETDFGYDNDKPKNGIGEGDKNNNSYSNSTGTNGLNQVQHVPKSTFNIYDDNGDYIGKISVLEYELKGSGLEIELGFKATSTKYTDYNWVQTVSTNKHPDLGYGRWRYNDPTGSRKDDNLPFYYTKSEMSGIKNIGGYTLNFYDYPKRSLTNYNIYWRAELSLVGKIGQVYHEITTLRYGFDLKNGNYIIQPLSSIPYSNSYKWLKN
jgi:RHS repeat-associated protein